MNIVKKLRPDRSLYLVWMTTFVLWWGAAFQPVQSRAAERMLSVVSSPAGLTIEAHDVGVDEVLREIGKQAGFAVLAKEATHPTVNISIKDATPEEVLQQILRGENYALVYRNAKGESARGSGGINKVLLLSPSGAVVANPAVESGGLEQERRQALSQNQAAATDSSEAEQTASVLSQEGWARLLERGDAMAQDGPVTVSDVLGGQALQMMLAKSVLDASSNSEQPPTGEDSETADAEPASGALSLPGLGADAQGSVQESFTVATQLAQRNLTALVEGLAAATNSLFNSQVNQGQEGR
jgi:hypothetical protein